MNFGHIGHCLAGLSNTDAYYAVAVASISLKHHPGMVMNQIFVIHAMELDWLKEVCHGGKGKLM
jgi:hypothetical protein